MTQRIPLQDLTSDAAVEHHSPQAKTTGRSPSTSGHIYVREIQGFFQRIRRYSNWLLIALVTGVTFVGYFTPVGGLVRDLFSLEAHPWALFWIGFFTLFTYLNAGWLRHQVCLHMCPYARFQSAMFDSHTLIVSYDSARGEPRRGHRKEVAEAAAGDCIDCELCVQVCPTGIDIRDGLQYECIGCAACIDACDSVMARIDKPLGLIRYTTERALEGKPTRFWRPQLLAYMAALFSMVVLLIGFLNARVPMDVEVARDRQTLFESTAEGRIINYYTVTLRNQDTKEHQYALSATGLPGLRLQGADTFVLAANETRQLRVALNADASALTQPSHPVVLHIAALDEPSISSNIETRFLGSTRQ